MVPFRQHPPAIKPTVLLSTFVLFTINKSHAFISSKNFQRNTSIGIREMRSKDSPNKVGSTVSSESTVATLTPPPTKSALGVIFDIDGTLADSWKLGFDATAVVLDRNGHDSITEKIYHEHCIWATPERLARHAGLEPGHPDFEEVGNRLGSEFDSLYVGLVSRETAGFYEGIADILNAMPDVVRIGALTNACVDYAHAVLEANCPVRSGEDVDAVALYDRFGSIHGADSVPRPKPSPDGLHVICEEIGLDACQCVYVGDAPSDAKAAKAAGMTAIGVLWGSNSEEKLKAAPFDYLCRNVEELRKLLPQVA